MFKATSKQCQSAVVTVILTGQPRILTTRRLEQHRRFQKDYIISSSLSQILCEWDTGQCETG